MTRTRHIAAVLFDEFEMLDLYGPLQMFSMHRDAYQITTVAREPGPVRASGGPETVAASGFGDARGFDMLLVPGGAGTRRAIHDTELLNWLAVAGAQAEAVLSVCTGSTLLAAAGLLDGRRATSNKRAFNWVAAHRPSVDWQTQARWVQDGSVYTSSGVSAGMDMALAVISTQIGPEAAADAALWAEYTPNTDPRNDPFAIEDQA